MIISNEPRGQAWTCKFWMRMIVQVVRRPPSLWIGWKSCLLILTLVVVVPTRFAQIGFSQDRIPDRKHPVAKMDQEKIAVLIIDGQNNHAAWPKTTAMMSKYLLDTGKFDVDVARTKFTWNGGELLKQFPLNNGQQYEDLAEPKSDPDFKPNFADYDVVVCNFGHGAAAWPDETKSAFVRYMKNGGGLVSIHAADNCFPDWPAYNQMIGMGGWGGRNESHGPYVYYNEDGKIVRDPSQGNGGGHGPQHEFSLVVRDPQHPIVAGLPREFLHAQDELYERLRGPAENMLILATAFAAPKFNGSGRHEPMLMAIEYEQGRVFHTTLGHADYSMEGVGFITTFLRGTEWAATGLVTIEVPRDFPTADKSSSRKFDDIGATIKQPE